ncbi:MAG: hypothetical protein J1G02_00585 [Clostridiales bacterium]|nr:hypothetical protein [Clostridiales bacterium]
MKKFLQTVKKIFANFWVQFLGLILVIAAILALAGGFASFEAFWDIVKDFITSGDTISIVVVAIATLLVASIALRARHKLEESLKIEDDHHKIITQYWGHAEPKKNKDGVAPPADIMYVVNTPSVRKKIKNCEKDEYSKMYVQRQKDIDAYVKDGKLYLPSVNVYANIDGNVHVKLDDSAIKHQLPKFVQDNSLALLEAHKGSRVSNGATIRLADVVIDGNNLTLKTQRSQYFDMLITNRCMDYTLNDQVSLRDVYESGSKVSPLSKSPFGNQIGINGLIFSNDGYLLVEKRGYKKTTWKNKFAQPISLAMKKSDVKAFKSDGTIEQDAETVFKDIILGTIENNFGLTDKNIVPFELSKNLFGIARDLLEGGKPNMYFYVIANMSAVELCKFIQKKAFAASKLRAPGSPKLTSDKLDSDYFLIKYSDIAINYKYELSVKARDVIFVKRLYYPRVSKFMSAMDGNVYRTKCLFNGRIKRECGEALLACLYYANECKDRINI